MSLLSVIIPIYNGRRFIGDTINMVLASEYSDIEIIAVNDGSNDDSASIVQKLQKEDTRIHLYNKENEGVVSARNFGVEKSNGDYICFVDQDDFVKPFMYSKLVDRLENDNSDMAMCSTGRNIDGSESGFDFQVDGKFEGDEIREQLLFPILFNGYDVPISHVSGIHYPHIWSCVFRKAFWDKIGLRFRAYINFEDDLLVKVEALSKANKVSTISDIGYLWRVNLKSETYAHHFVENIGMKQNLEYNDMLQSMAAFNPSDELLEFFQKVWFCKQYVIAVHYLTSPEIKVTPSFIKEYYEKNIYSRQFEKSIGGRKLLRKGRIKPAVLLPLLSKHKTLLSYLAELVLDKILLFSLRSQLLTRLERRLKVEKKK